MKFIKAFLIIACMSFSILGLCTLASYFIYKESSTNFKIGWPFNFYYQFAVNVENGYEIQHGTNPGNFVYNCGLSFIFIVLIFLSLKKTREYIIRTFI